MGRSFAVAIVVAMLSVMGIAASDQLTSDELQKLLHRVSVKAWESFHVSIDENHSDESQDWMDDKDRRKLLKDAVNNAISAALREQEKITRELEIKKRPPRPQIALGSLAWMDYCGEPKQVRVDRGPSEDRQYLIRMTVVVKTYSSGSTYPRYGYPSEIPIESLKERYQLVDENLLYFAEKVSR